MEHVKALKASVVPLRFKEINERELGEYNEQLERLKELYGDVAEFLNTVIVGDSLPAADRSRLPLWRCL